MSTETTKLLIKTSSRSSTELVQYLTEAEIGKVQSMAEAIRMCIKKYPDATNSSIAKFLSQYHTKDVRPQWVFNVRHQQLKTK